MRSVVEQTLNVVANHYGYQGIDLLTMGRKQPYVFIRMIAGHIFSTRIFPKQPIDKPAPIASCWGGSDWARATGYDHATLYHGNKVIEGALESPGSLPSQFRGTDFVKEYEIILQKVENEVKFPYIRNNQNYFDLTDKRCLVCASPKYSDRIVSNNGRTYSVSLCKEHGSYEKEKLIEIITDK